jgi:hypothetical protein
VDDPRDVAAQRQQNIQPELQADTDLQEYADRWQDDREKNAYDVQGRLVHDFSISRIETRTGAVWFNAAREELMTDSRIAQDLIAQENEKRATALKSDYEALGANLSRRGVDIEAITRRVSEFFVAVPSWGVGTGGTRFARFPGTGEPRGIFDKLDDCSVINELTRATPNVSLHIPWDKTDVKELKAKGNSLGLGFDAMNSNTFSDAPDQAFLQIRLAQPHGCCDPRAGRRAQSSNASRSARRSAPRR